MATFHVMLSRKHLKFTSEDNGRVNVGNLGVGQVHKVLEVGASPFLVVRARDHGVTSLELASPTALQIFSENLFWSLAL